MVENEKPDPEDLSPPGEEKPQEEEGYRLAGDTETGGKTAAETADWYYVVGEQPRQGPVSLGDLQRLVAAGQLGPQDRVWRSGLPEWTSVAQVAELHDAPPPPPPPRPRPVIELPDDDVIGSFRTIERKLTDPLVLRIAGWACGGLGLFFLILSLPLAFWGRSWFVGAVLLLVAFLMLLALARVVETAER